MSTGTGSAVSQSIMMQLGSFQFCIATAAYQELTRRAEFRWPSQELFGKLPALQYTGPASQTITLIGVIYPDYNGSQFMLAKMRVLAERGRPLPLIGGAGVTFGRWVIESVEEKQSTFALEGAPRRQDFTLQLRMFDVRQAEATSAPGSLSSIVGGTLPVSSSSAPTILGKVASAVDGFASNAGKMASDAVSSASGALDKVNGVAASIGNAASPVVASVQSAIGTARAVKDAVSAMKSGVKSIKSFDDLQSAMYSVMSATSAASNAGALASTLAGNLVPEITASGIPSDTIQVIKECQAACGTLAVSAASIYSQGNSILADAKNILK